MPNRAPRIGAIAAVLISTACGWGGGTTHRTATSGAGTCVPADRPALSACWALVAPLGSGGFPPEKGSFDRPKWEPGRWPLTPEPVIGFNGDLWMMSQTHAWSSSDGLHWTHYLKTDWGERINEAYAFFRSRLWMFGGLRYHDRDPLNDIWTSSDGKTWTNLGNAAWSPRKGHTIVVFRNQLWLLAGADKVQPDFSTVHALDDVWRSDDGLHWTQVTAAAAWSPREGAKLVTLKDALYLLGGQGQADVWRSDDGINWTQQSAQADWKPRFGYGAAGFGDWLWVYAGWKGKPTNALNDIWYSTDGKAWLQQTEHAPWAPRSPRTIVYKDRLWIFSGKHTGFTDNWGGDIWTMSLPP